MVVPPMWIASSYRGAATYTTWRRSGWSREDWVIKIAGRVAAHADAFHHGAGADVCFGGEGDDFRKAQPAKSVLQNRSRRFACVSMPPGFARQTPTDFNPWRKRIVRQENEETRDADESAVVLAFDSKSPKAVFPVVRFEPVDSGQI